MAAARFKVVCFSHTYAGRVDCQRSALDAQHACHTVLYCCCCGAQVLDALAEVAFEPEFLPSRIEKERKAVVAEAQMMNTIEYRVDCQLLQYLHWENALGCRFPIGKTDLVGGWRGWTMGMDGGGWQWNK